MTKVVDAAGKTRINQSKKKITCDYHYFDRQETSELSACRGKDGTLLVPDTWLTEASPATGYVDTGYPLGEDHRPHPVTKHTHYNFETNEPSRRRARNH